MKRVAIVLVGSWLVACGGDSGPSAPTTTDGGEMIQTTTGPYLPWSAGNRWTYRITDGDKIETKIVTVGAAEPVGAGPNAAVVANRVTSVTLPDKQTIVWQGTMGDLNVRFRDQGLDELGAVEEENVWSPYRVYFDGAAAHVARAATWTAAFDETKTKTGKTPVTTTQMERWTVVAVDEVVSVPAGAYRALVVQKAGGSSLKTYWYVRGVGKVKETGGQVEELISFEIK